MCFNYSISDQNKNIIIALYKEIMEPDKNIDLDKMRNILSYFSKAQLEHSLDQPPPSVDEMETIIQAIATSTTNKPLQAIVENEAYENWWKQNLAQQSTFKGGADSIEKEWQKHHKLLAKNDKQIKDNLFSFASALDKFPEDKAFGIRDDALQVISTLGSLLAITIASLSMTGAGQSFSKSASMDSQEALHSTFLLSYITKIYQDVKDKKYASASINFTQSLYNLARLSIATMGSTMIAGVATALPFVGIGLFAAGAALNEHLIKETKQEIADSDKKIKQLTNEIENPPAHKSFKDKIKDRRDLVDEQKNLVQLKAKLQKKYFTRGTLSVTAAITATAFTLAMVGGSVATAGVLPAALAIGFATISIGITIASKYHTKKVAKQSLKEQLRFQHGNLTRDIDSLKNQGNFQFDNEIKTPTGKITFNDYLDNLIKQSPEDAKKVLDQLDVLVASEQAMEKLPGSKKEKYYIESEKHKVELEKMTKILDGIKIEPADKISATVLFENSGHQRGDSLSISETLLTEEEENIFSLTTQLKDIDEKLQTNIFTFCKEQSLSELIQERPDAKDSIIAVAENIVTIDSMLMQRSNRHEYHPSLIREIDNLKSEIQRSEPQETNSASPQEEKKSNILSRMQELTGLKKSDSQYKKFAQKAEESFARRSSIDTLTEKEATIEPELTSSRFRR